MRVLIMDQKTQMFLGHQDQWSDNAREGKDFSFTAHARNVANNLKLARFQVLFFFPDIDYRIVVCEAGNEMQPMGK
jgi:hypothetical protein